MKFLIVAVGKVSNKDFEGKIIAQYLRKFTWKVEFKQIEPENNLKKTSQKMLKAIDKVDFAVLLDKTGKHYSSEDFASYLDNLCNRSISKIAFLIGGAEGFHKDIFDDIPNVISLGHMTYSHKLAKLILVEQLYRAWAILHNHPYPK